MNDYEFYEPQTVAIFDDVRNIEAGTGRVIYARETITARGELCREGWVLPGGRRITDWQRAWGAAMEMHQMSMGLATN